MKINKSALCVIAKSTRDANVQENMERYCNDAGTSNTALTSTHLHQELMEMRLMVGKCPHYKDARKITRLIDDIEKSLLGS